jgi:hypothetical protein
MKEGKEKNWLFINPKLYGREANAYAARPFTVTITWRRDWRIASVTAEMPV